jgi:hypothetical protein
MANFPLRQVKCKEEVMDDLLRKKISAFASELARDEQEPMKAKGKLVDLEVLTAEIGDELSRQLASQELSRRSAECSSKPLHACPDCGRECSIDPDLEPVILQGIRGDIEYQEPRCFCPHCRRAFFPCGGTATTSAS